MIFLIFLATLWLGLLPSTNHLHAMPRLPRSSSSSLMARRCWVSTEEELGSVASCNGLRDQAA